MQMVRKPAARKPIEVPHTLVSYKRRRTEFFENVTERRKEPNVIGNGEEMGSAQ